jgi:ATP-dependent Clp protease adaptor protein ClpS
MKPLKQNKERTEGHPNKGSKHTLILYDDDHHTFDYVINSLVEVCSHDTLQATQCTYLVHFKKMCEVKTGSMELLRPMRDELVNRELKAKIR